VAWAFGELGFGVSADSPIARISILLEASMKPMRSRGRISGQGNLVEAKAMLKKAGNAIAAIQRRVFHFSRFFFSEFVIGYALSGLLLVCSLEMREHLTLVLEKHLSMGTTLLLPGNAGNNKPAPRT
jgi:hypothetical protein